MGRTHLPDSVTVNDREYRWPKQPLVVVCLDGSSFDYIKAASTADLTPYLTSLVSAGNFRMVQAAMPTFTNPNNVSIVTGVSPAFASIYVQDISQEAQVINRLAKTKGIDLVLDRYAANGQL